MIADAAGCRIVADFVLDSGNPGAVGSALDPNRKPPTQMVLPSRRSFVSRAPVVVTLLLAHAMSASIAGAHDEPKRARLIRAPLVTAYEPCTAPNTFTGGDIPIPACAPPKRSDTECGFQGPYFKAGYGKATAATKTLGDLRLSFVAEALGPGCEGRRLCAFASIRMTTDRCLVHPCTVDLPNLYVDSPTGCCTVERGACRVSTSINSELLGLLQPGEKTGIEINGCGLKRTDGPNLPAGLTFSCGVLAP